MSSYDDIVNTGKRFYNSYGNLLNKYKGGMHVGFLAAIAAHESSGRMASVGDASLGEIGFFQIAANTPGRFGLPANLRMEPEGNIAIATIEYNVEAYYISKSYPFIIPGTPEQWMFSRLVFAIGKGGTRGVLSKLPPGPGAYARLVELSKTGTLSGAGTQSAAKIANRIQSVPMLWQAGQEIVPMASFGRPSAPPAPPGYKYRLPKDVSFGPSPILVAGAAALAVKLLGLV